MKKPRGVGLTAVGLSALALFGQAFILYGIRGPQARWLGGVLAAGLVLTPVGLVRWWRQAEKQEPHMARAQKVRIVAAVVVGIGLFAAFITTYAVSAIESAEYFCERVSYAPTMKEREDAWVESLPRWARARRFDFVASCYSAQGNRQAYADGRCPFIPAVDGPCNCAGQQWPGDWHEQGPVKCVSGRGLMARGGQGFRQRWFLPWNP